MAIGIRIGVPFVRVISSGGGGFSPEYEAILARANALSYALPSAGVQVLQNTLVKDLVDGGVWAKLDHLKIYAGSNADFSLINWVTPANFLSTKVNSPTYGYAYGFKGGVANEYLETGFTPSGSLNYKQDDACYFNYRKSENSGGSNQTQNYMGAYGFSSNSALIGSWGTNNFETYMNAGGDNNNYSSGGATVGLTLINRNNSSNYNVWLNGSNIATVATASVAIPTTEFLTCKLSVTGSSDAERSMEGAGAALTSGQIATLTNSFATYLAAL
tara:strand:- start:4325 stop:5143 length:819 start_codon:yes stop_codon:yes gene_type:complete